MQFVIKNIQDGLMRIIMNFCKKDVRKRVVSFQTYFEFRSIFLFYHLDLSKINVLIFNAALNVLNRLSHGT